MVAGFSCFLHDQLPGHIDFGVPLLRSCSSSSQSVASSLLPLDQLVSGSVLIIFTLIPLVASPIDSLVSRGQRAATTRLQASARSDARTLLVITWRQLAFLIHNSHLSMQQRVDHSNPIRSTAESNSTRWMFINSRLELAHSHSSVHSSCLSHFQLPATKWD